MATDYYSNTESAEPMVADAAESDNESSEDVGETALIPLSFLGEAEPGDTITLRVVRVLDDQVEVASEGGYGEPEMEMSEEMPMQAGPPGGGMGDLMM